MNGGSSQYIVYKTIDLFLAVLMFMGFVCYLPMLLGVNYIAIGMGMFLLIIFLYVVRRNGRIGLAKKSGLRVYVTSMLLFFYCLVQSIVLKSDRLQIAIQTCILLMFAVTFFYIILSDRKMKALFIKTMYAVLMFFSVSYIVSVLLMLAGGWERIFITSFDYGYFTETKIFFPFTTTYGSMAFNGIVFRRLLGFARESGIMQIFYIWAFFMADKYYIRPGWIRFFMAIGVAGCLSTAGFVVFGISLILYLDMNKVFSRKTLLIFMLFAVVIYILFYAQGTRVVDRASGTIEQRMLGIEYGLSVFKEHPILGGGFYSTLGDANIQSGICALASLGQVGIIGIGLWIFIFVFAFIDSKNKKRFLYTNAALFITALFAQPMVFAPVMYWFLFVDYDDSRVVLVRHNSKKERQLLRGVNNEGFRDKQC